MVQKRIKCTILVWPRWLPILFGLLISFLFFYSNAYAGVTKLGMVESDQHNVFGDLSVSNVLTATNINRVIVVEGDTYARTDVGIQAAITALGGAGEVFLPEGTYTITTAIDLNNNSITLRGSGNGTILNTSGAIQTITATGRTNLLIANLQINGGNLNGIYFDNVDESRIHGVLVTSCGQDGIYLTGDSDNNIIIGSTITNTTGESIEIGAACNNNVITGCYCDDSINDLGDTTIINSDSNNGLILESVANTNINLTPGGANQLVNVLTGNLQVGDASSRTPTLPFSPG